MKKIATLLFFLLLSLYLSAQVPQIINYQGRMTVGGVNFNGNGQYKFALVNGAGTVLWSNSPLVSGQPGSAVVLPVTNGLYSVFLGDTTMLNMAAIPASVFSGADVRLRIWFNNGAIGFQQLSPDQRIGAVAYAIMADGVKDGAITSSKLAAGAVTSTALANGAVTSSAIANGAVGSPQLGAGAVSAGNIADGTITTAKIANGAVTGAQIADGAIPTNKLAKQYDGGSINIYDSDLAGFPSSKEITIPFHLPFLAVPSISLGLGGNDTDFLATLRPSQKDQTTTGFKLLINGLSHTDQQILSVTAAEVSSRGVVSQSVTAVDMVVLAAGPAVVYVEDGRLYFRRALDVSGTNWASPTLLDSVDAGTKLDLYVQNGNPAVAYATGAGVLYFIRATDAPGTLWGARGTALASGVNSRPVGGKSGVLPALVVFDFTNNRLQFCRATDAAGTAWAAAVALPATNGTLPDFWDFTTVNGQPAVCFSASTAADDSDLFFLRSTTDGVSWPGSAQAVVQDPSSVRRIGKNPRFLLLNGNPGIFYATRPYSRTVTDASGGSGATHQESAQAGVYCVRASDASGGAWGSPVEITTSVVSAEVGDALHPGIVGGIPMLIANRRLLTFTRDANGQLQQNFPEDLSLYKANDVNGSAWTLVKNFGEARAQRPSGLLHSLESAPAWVGNATNEVTVFKYQDRIQGTDLPAPEATVKQSNGAIGATILASGKPLLAFFDPGEKTLKVSTCADPYGTQWNSPQTIAADGGGFYLSSYGNSYAYNIGNLVYAGPYGAARLTATALGATSLGSVQGLPAMAYVSGSPKTLYFVKASSFDGLTWGAPVVVQAGPGSSIHADESHLLIASGFPAIVFRQDTSIKIARATNAAGTAWSAAVTIVTDANLQDNLRAGLIAGNPAVVYGSASGATFTVKFIRATDASGTAWAPLPSTAQTLPGFVPGTFHSLALAEIGGTPAIALHYTITGNLTYTRTSVVSGSSGWTAPVELDTKTGKDTSARGRTMDLIPGARPIVVYEAQNDLEEANLRRVIANDATGSSWGLSANILSAGNVGQFATASLSGDALYAACYDQTRELTIHLKSTDGGQTWTIVSQGQLFASGEHFCLTMAGTNPVVFLQKTDGLYYARANNPEGTSWDSPTSLQAKFTPAIAGPGAGFFPSAAMVGGFLCVSFYDADYGNLYFKRSGTPTGGAWGASVNIVATNDVGGYSSLAEIGGRPAVAYYNFTNKTLHYSRALDAVGNSWASPVTVVGAAGNGEYCQLSILNGLPVILYYSSVDRQLMLVRALDANGAAWASPSVVDDGRSISSTGGIPNLFRADVGRFAKLAVVNGKPNVVYTDSTNRDLVFKRANDASGSSWGSPVILASDDDTGLFPTMVGIGNIPSVFHFDRARKSIRNILPTLPFSASWTAVEK